MSDSEEQVFLTLRQSSFGNSSVPTTATDFCAVVACYESLNFKAVYQAIIYGCKIYLLFFQKKSFKFLKK